MMKRTLLSALILVVALLLSVLLITACSGNGDNGNTATTEGVTEAPTVRPTLDLPKDGAAVDALIAAIDGATLENEDKIDLAYLGYWSLDEAERAKVTGYETLQTLRYELTKEYVVKEYKDTRIPHNEFLIGVYYSDGVYDDQYAQAVVDAGIDFVWCPYTADPAAMDLYQRYGIGVFMNLIFTGIPGSFHMTEEYFRDAVSGKTYDHEAIWLIDHLDEPGHPSYYVDLWRSGKIIIEELYPGCGYLQNLLPQETESDVSLYVNAIGTHTKALSFDHYLYSTGNLLPWLRDLYVYSKYGREGDCDLYVIGQVGNWEEKGALNQNQLKFQVYTAMAYGAKSFTWACWNDGWWKYGMVDRDRNKTERYDMVQEINRDLKALEPVYMRYTGQSNVVIYDNAPIKKTLQDYEGNQDVNAMTQTSLTDITAGDNSGILLGHFEKNVGKGEAFLFMGLNNYHFHNNKTQIATVTFKTTDSSAVLTAYVKGIPSVLTPDENGVYAVEIVDADAVFVTVD